MLRQTSTSNHPSPPVIDTCQSYGERALSAGHYWLVMSLVILAAGVARVAILVEFVAVNPLAELPSMDGLEYWTIAGRCAEGRWAQATPFLSAPLYPYFLGLLRLLGADLITVTVVQMAMHLVTAVITGEAARAAWGRAAGFVATVAFLLLTEPAVVFTRLFAENLQILLGALLVWRWVMLARQQRPGWGGVAVCSVLIGLLALTYPPAILLIPAWCVWLGLANGRAWRAVRQPLLGACLAAVTISPATLHNWLLHGELIPITAHSGITLRQGNGPDATGIIHSIPGIVARRDTMHHDAAAVFREIHGRDGTWREIDRHFRSDVLRYWMSHPVASLRLVGRKAWLFLTARHYGDMLAITVEREIGMCQLSVLAPLAVPWLMGAALVGLMIILREPVRSAPFWVLTLLPFVIVTVFFYTPRYRFPAIPTLCGLAAMVIVRLPAWPLPRRWLALGACALPALGAVINYATGIDSPGNERAHVLASFSEAQTAAAGRRIEVGRFATAESRLKNAVVLDADNIAAYEMLIRLYRETNLPEQAVEPLRQIVRLAPDDIGVRKSLYNVLCQIGDLVEAADVLRKVVAMNAEDGNCQLALAWLEATAPDDRVRDGEAALERVKRWMEKSEKPTAEVFTVLAAAQAECGRFEEAARSAREGSVLARQQGEASMKEALELAAAAFAREQPLRAMPKSL